MLVPVPPSIVLMEPVGVKPKVSLVEPPFKLATLVKVKVFSEPLLVPLILQVLLIRLGAVKLSPLLPVPINALILVKPFVICEAVPEVLLANTTLIAPAVSFE